MQKVLITGVSGFVGFHLAKKLADEYMVYGIDIPQEPQSIYTHRLQKIKDKVNYSYCDIRDQPKLGEYLATVKPEVVIHLAACTGIAASEANRQLYFDTNVLGFSNLLQHCKASNVQHLIYASSSSVYNHLNEVYRETDEVENQLSYYGKTKRQCETLAANYASQFGLNCIGLRFFTVYGSWVRTDMAAWKFMRAVDEGKPCTLYNNGEVYRDFTHVSDIVESIFLLLKKSQTQSRLPAHEVYNIGHGSPVSVLHYLQTIASCIGKEPIVHYAPLPANELPRTHADTTKLQQAIGFKPVCSLESGVREMVEWYKQYSAGAD